MTMMTAERVSKLRDVVKAAQEWRSVPSDKRAAALEQFVRTDAPDLLATAEESRKLLEDVEEALSKSREHNPWDLGPSALLVRVRAAIGKPA